MDGLETILTRRSCRVYTDKLVPDEVIEKLLRAGMYAPSAHNSQPWEFLVFRDKDKKKITSEQRIYWKMLDSAPLGILVMADLEGYKGSTNEFFVQDCSAATENILLAAHAMGLGGVWLGLYPKADYMEKIRSIFEIPENIIPFSLISIGYPAQTPHPHTTYHDAKVHYDNY